MLKNYKIIVEYDGTNFHGWQKQIKTRTIQGELEKAIGIITQKEITVSGSGRTDAGVHALAQTANFKCDSRLTPEEMQNALNSLTGPDLSIKICEYADGEFHARFRALKKSYRYQILNSKLPSPTRSRFTWHISKKLDLTAMKRASRLIIGNKDFKSFEATGSPRHTTVRTISFADFTISGDLILFQIEANGFLRYMVRNIVGTLVDIGLHKTSVDEFKEIINACDRKKAGATAPAHGLFLIKVDY